MYNVQTYVDTINNQLLVESYGVIILNMIAIQTLHQLKWVFSKIYTWFG